MIRTPRLVCEVVSGRLFQCHMRFFASSPVAFNSRVHGEKAEERALQVSVIGCPNVGKSALTNALIRANVCAVSEKVDTTRANTTASLTEKMCQLIVVDSPGLIGNQHAKKLIGTHSEARILTDPEKAIERAEHILLVHDPSLRGEFLHHRVLHLLHRHAHIPSTLVINKVDLVERRTELLKLANVLTEGVVGGQRLDTKPARLGLISSIINRNRAKDGISGPAQSLHPVGVGQEKDERWHALYNKLMARPTHKCSWHETKKLFGDQLGYPNFNALFFVSAINGEGIDALRVYLRDNAPARQWKFDPQAKSLTDPRQLCAEHTRSALLDCCPHNVGYGLQIRVSEWEMAEYDDGTGQRQSGDNKLLRIATDVNCDKKQWVRLVARHVGNIEAAQQKRLSELFDVQVEFRLFLRHKGKLCTLEMTGAAPAKVATVSGSNESAAKKGIGRKGRRNGPR